MIAFSIFFGFTFSTLSSASAGLMLSSFHQTSNSKLLEQDAATISHMNLVLSVMLIIIAFGLLAFVFSSTFINPTIFIISMATFTALYSYYLHYIGKKNIKNFGSSTNNDV